MSQRRSSSASSTPAQAASPPDSTVKKIQAGHFARRLEKACAVSLVLAMCSQLNAQVSLPTYNSVLAGWGLFAAYSRRGPAVFGLLALMGLSFVLDAIFLSIWSSGESAVLARDDDSTTAATTAFSVAMMSLNLAAKTAAMYFAAHLYAVLSQPQVPHGRGPNASNNEVDADVPTPGRVSFVGRSSGGTPPATSEAAALRQSEPLRGNMSPRSPSSRGASSEFKTDESPMQSPSSSQPLAPRNSSKGGLVRPPGAAAVPNRVPALNLSRSPAGSGAGVVASPLESERKDTL
jgi:hypothetical protein